MTNKGRVSLAPAADKRIDLGGTMGRLLRNICDRWLIDITETNPAIIEMLKSPDLRPYRPLLPWSGEFAGKYLTGAVSIYAYTGDERLGSCIDEFVGEVLECQQKNGYIGPFSKEYQLSGHAAPAEYIFENSGTQAAETWDCWGHYHIMRALMLWYRTAGSEAALSAACRIADMFCESFYGENIPMSSVGCCEMNLAVLHSFALLYQITESEKYLRFAKEILKDAENESCGDFMRQALCGTEFYKMSRPRWEGIHIIEGFETLYEITGDEDFRRAFMHLWQSVTKTDVHVTGGFTTDEQAMGTPFKEGRIETCCTVAYMALTCDMLRLTGDSVCADVMEWCTLNSGIGAFSPSGRWSTYDTPMRGYKRANYHTIGFQSRPGSPDLNCCSVNAPRVFGFLGDWAYMFGEEDGALYVQYYGESDTVIQAPDGGEIRIRQETRYPRDGRIVLHISDGGTTPRTVRLRIPFWSENTTVTVGGESRRVPCGYYTLTRLWGDDTEIVLEFDFSLQYQAGEEDFAGLGAVFYGPLVLCLDSQHNPGIDFTAPPTIDAQTCRALEVRSSRCAGILVDVNAADGTTLALCDLYTAGVTGTPYTCWLPTVNMKRCNATSANPARRAKPDKLFP